MRNKLIDIVEKPSLKEGVTAFKVGDTVDVHCKIVEGDKERVQIFSGTVLGRKGRGTSQTFTVRRIVNNEGVERIFPVNSPFIAKIVVKRSADVRRSKLYYLRDRVGKATRLSESTKDKGKKEEAAEPVGAAS